ncbi:MAG: S-layer homology domain-containing protein [Candidatus Caenarcaniphilales bacterium]|jgi:hypothetical protein|nr:S-layer homology domain-containing protein [Candidatus Caenarcaniphilales bacterium]
MKLNQLSILTLSLVSFQIFPALAIPRDVPKSHWAYDSVNKVTSQGFMNGDANGNFGGSRSLTRYEFAKTLSRIMDHYDNEMKNDRKNVEDMVAIMELFQNELKVLEVKLNKASEEVQVQNTTINELNELAIALGQEYKTFSTGPDGGSTTVSLGEKIAQIEKDIYKLKNKGLFVDTLIMGTVNDMKKLGSATSKAFSRSRKNVQKRVESESETIKTDEVKSMGNETLEEFKTQASVTIPEFSLEDGGRTKKITTHTTQQTVESKSTIEGSGTLKPEEYELLEEIH